MGTEGEMSSKTEEKVSKVATFLGYFIILGPLYYFIVWKNILPGTTKTKNIITVILSAVVLIGYFFVLAREKLLYEKIRNFIIVTAAILAAPLIAIYFVDDEKTLFFKIFTVFYFSFLPAWLYLQFMSTKGKTLWDEYVLNLFRLRIDQYAYLPKPPVNSTFYAEWSVGQVTQPKNTDPLENIYEKKFEGLFGAIPSGKGLAYSIFRGENLWPVIIATLIISVGWVMVVELESILNISLISSAVAATGGLKIPHEIFRFAFLGAYFYILQMLVRRYFQNDLKTSAYVNATMRIIVVILLVWVLSLISGSAAKNSLSALAFVIGVFPYVGWQALQAFLKLPIKLVLPSLRQQYPLSDLDGLNIWYESRLLEEGIEDMQNLATANMVDLMLHTRIPVERLVDWVDQSLLYLHLGKSDTRDLKGNRDRIRLFGIRCATDLEDVFESGDTKFIEKMEYVLNDDEKGPSILRSIYTTLKNEPNLFHVKQWKAFSEKYINRAKENSA